MIVGNGAFGGSSQEAYGTPIRRLIGVSWKFLFTWYQSDGITPQDLSGKTIYCDLIASGQFDPVYTAQASVDEDTNLQMGQFKFVFPPNLIARPSGNIVNSSQDLARIHVRYVDGDGTSDSVLIQYVQAVIP